MGRHRRSAAGRAAGGDQPADATGRGRAPLPPGAGDHPTRGIAPYLNPEAYSGARARSDAYLFAPDAPEGDGRGGHPRAGRTVAFPGDGHTPDDGPQRAGTRRRRRKKAVTPVRTGLLGVSAAVAIGTVAVATGAVPGLDDYRLGGSGGSDRVQSQDAPVNSPAEQGGTSGSADTGTGGDASTSRGGDRSSSPSSSGSSSGSSSAQPSASASKPAAPAETPSKTSRPKTTPSAKPEPTPSRPATKAPAQPGAPAAASEQAVAESQVQSLVNDERAKVGCSPLAANSALRELAEDFSEAMAAQGFFDHTDPSGATPWARAEAAGISNLGGENIARGQADAQAVMAAWMNSPGHRANILNCDFRTLGVGVHFGSGGPWWTQNFGY
ncbi:CAP domain-containing protein [Streptomyces lancefieldiae]|uniref:CAP domain-containing protein n=1 Tax=Streptomyces lancefieldiae TaxID=3075520 RepID=A0ABU3AH22_9ACTN|nr:CAP domain-containing protein [Streptomyces sp. DSM 40712]MDT0609489.1 CAP domain-containing protein [Streptomyces sp. DSM 40712]